MDKIREKIFSDKRLYILVIMFTECFGQGLFAFMNINIINAIAETKPD